MRWLINLLIEWPRRLAEPLSWLGPLVARVTVGWVFASSGWAHLHNPDFVSTFQDAGIPWPGLLLPFSSWVEFVGGILVAVGLFTRVAAVPLAINMLVAIRAVLWSDLDSVGAFLLLDETAYCAIFIWLAAAGPGRAALDPWLAGRVRSAPG